jgi:molecular chaperone GrpE
MLDIADNLERALSAVPQDKVASSTEPGLKVLLEGVEMTEKSLQKVFAKFGIVKYGAVGDVFDPALHEALFRITDPTKEAGKIGNVLKTGYKLNDRVIRAAEVGTIVHPEQ